MLIAANERDDEQLQRAKFPLPKVRSYDLPMSTTTKLSTITSESLDYGKLSCVGLRAVLPDSDCEHASARSASRALRTPPPSTFVRASALETARMSLSDLYNIRKVLRSEREDKGLGAGLSEDKVLGAQGLADRTCIL
jgi:hypothetical protein